nr:MAG TPA: Repressor protein CI [Caudoviricetes sp.]
MSIGQRIREIRKEKKITQQSLADSLGLKQNTVASYEIDRVQPSDRTINDICDKFKVNEQWLRTGEGEPFLEITRNEAITDFMSDILNEDNTFKNRLIAALAKLDESQWKVLEQIAEESIKKD